MVQLALVLNIHWKAEAMCCAARGLAYSSLGLQVTNCDVLGLEFIHSYGRVALDSGPVSNGPTDKAKERRNMDVLITPNIESTFIMSIEEKRSVQGCDSKIATAPTSRYACIRAGGAPERDSSVLSNRMACHNS